MVTHRSLEILQRACLAFLLYLLAAPVVLAQTDFAVFESLPVRPVALSASGTELYVTNVPDGHLEIFSVGPTGLLHTASVPVGVEPVAVAERVLGEVWVVNHLSDSVSIVDTTATPPRVVRTVLVGDEPRGIAFGGVGSSRVTGVVGRGGVGTGETASCAPPSSRPMAPSTVSK